MCDWCVLFFYDSVRVLRFQTPQRKKGLLSLLMESRESATACFFRTSTFSCCSCLLASPCRILCFVGIEWHSAHLYVWLLFFSIKKFCSLRLYVLVFNRSNSENVTSISIVSVHSRHPVVYCISVTRHCTLPGVMSFVLADVVFVDIFIVLFKIWQPVTVYGSFSSRDWTDKGETSQRSALCLCVHARMCTGQV